MTIYNLNIDMVNSSLAYFQAEKYIYGSSRLGMLKDSVNVLGSAYTNTDTSNFIHTLGNKRYEFSNHLGNVLTVLSDKPIPHGNGGTVDYFMADIKSSQDYSPFGVTLSGRNFNSDSSYRFGFNSMERDDEIKGRGNSYNYTYRMHDPRLGRFFAVDPLADNFSSNSSYSFAMNSVIKFKELEGLELYVCGTNSDEFINLLSARTGLEFSKNPNGMLVVTTTILRIPNIFNPSEIIETPIPNVNSSDNISMTLRKVVFAVTVGVDNNGNKLEVVDVMASSSSEIAKINSTGVDDVLFDSFRTEKSEKTLLQIWWTWLILKQ
jgi:RHS repeat-associated protein